MIEDREKMEKIAECSFHWRLRTNRLPTARNLHKWYGAETSTDRCVICNNREVGDDEHWRDVQGGQGKSKRESSRNGRKTQKAPAGRKI
jgi:hypothetical protein